MAQTTNMQLCFDPNLHPDNTLTAFTEFIQTFELRYEATYPDPPKVSLDSAIQRWTLTQQDANAKPDVTQYDEIRDKWRSRDMVVKFLGLHSTKRMHSDWLIAQPSEEERKTADWKAFITKMKTYYQPTENITLKHYQFRSLTQERNESFSAFSIRVEKEANYCKFKCAANTCTADEVAIRDQIIIGLLNDEIRQEALKNSWDLKELRSSGTRIESAYKGAAEISGDGNVNKMGRYSYKNIKGREEKKEVSQKNVNCYFCGSLISITLIAKHAKRCPARSAKCDNCGKDGHSTKACNKKADVKEVSKEDESKEDDNNPLYPSYNINLFRISDQSSAMGNDFKVQMIINNSMDKILADTGAKISVCGVMEAKKWNIYNRMVPSQVKIKPYNSKPILVVGTARCAVTIGNRSVPVQWHIIQDKCEPILAGKTAEQLGIIKFSPEPDVLQPVNMIQHESKDEIQCIIQEYKENFHGVGKLKKHQVKIHYDQTKKPIAEGPRTTPYHLRERVNEILNEMIKQDIIEEHPKDEPALWTSNIVIVPKPNGDLRITLDARNVNKIIFSSNIPIPRHEDIKAKLAGAKVFSKMDLKSAFWQLELQPESRHLTTFHGGNGKLYRQKRLSMGLKSAQGELNAALAPLFADIQQVHLIHDDLIIAAKSLNEHNEILRKVMKILSESGLTLNPQKCIFGTKEIHFWGLKISDDGIRPDPSKVEALKYISIPRNKSELLSFLCMMQSNADFITNFSQKAATLRELTKNNVRFKWESKHQECFDNLVHSFTKETLLQYFDLEKDTFIIVDAHQTGLGAILAQGDSLKNAKPVAIASRTTSETERRYPQIDLEATALDFSLRRFRNYVVGAPKDVVIVTDHKPLCSIFNGKKKGSVRTERIKMRNQDIRFSVSYQKGSMNQSDYISRHARPLKTINEEERKEADEFNNLLYTLHTTPIIDSIGLSTIAKETSNDETLSELRKYIQMGKNWIPKAQSEKLNKFKKIMSEITATGNGILLKGDRIVLPESLQMKAIELAHRGAHPGQSGLLRRLRYLFFFHNMDKQVNEIGILNKG